MLTIANYFSPCRRFGNARFPAKKYERFSILGAELAQQKLDLLVWAAGIAAACNNRDPNVAVNVPDPVGRKLVATLNRPRGNLTGLSNMARRTDDEAHRTRERDD